MTIITGGCPDCRALRAQYGPRARCANHCLHAQPHGEGMPCVAAAPGGARRGGRPARRRVRSYGGTD